MEKNRRIVETGGKWRTAQSQDGKLLGELNILNFNIMLQVNHKADINTLNWLQMDIEEMIIRVVHLI